MTSIDASTDSAYGCRRGEDIQKGVAALQREREALERCVLDMAGKTVALDHWLADNEAKVPSGQPGKPVVTEKRRKQSSAP